MEKIFDNLFPINRSIMGKGYNNSLKILNNLIPTRNIKFNSGTKAFDWKIPDEWIIEDAYIITPNGKKICEFKKNNLHLVSYSKNVKKNIKFSELKKKLFYIKKNPNAIPYVTSYYKRDWGFCISYKDYKKLSRKGNYKVVIKSKFKKGKLVVGEALIKGKTKNEILFTSYLCHPSMANNELSGPIMLGYLYNFLKKRKRIYNHSIRFLINPETIGTIAYLSKNYKILKKRVKAGYVLTCVGDNGKFHYKETIEGNSVTDIVVRDVLKKYKHKILKYSPFGSDERQYNSSGIKIPIGSLMRTPYGQFKEYHTSLDNKKLINFKKMREMILVYTKIFDKLDSDFIIKPKVNMGEPFLSKYNLYRTLSSYNFHKSDVNSVEEKIFIILSRLKSETSYIKLLYDTKIKKNIFNKVLKILKQKKIIDY